jgi:hypothetical protein
MTKKNYHVVPNGNDWSVKREGASRSSSNHGTQKEAISAGKNLARTNLSELVIHRPDGRIRDSDSYGNDPCPPRDRIR